MAQISLFDFEAPPPPISGETYTLSPLDVLIFAPTSAIAKTGEKLTSSILSSISKLFAPKTVTLPAQKGLATIADIAGGRTPGAPFKLSGGTSATSTANLVSKIGPTKEANTITVPGSLSSIFSGKVNPNLAIVGGIAGTTLGTTALLTSTEGGQNLVNTGTDTIKGITNFFTENPLLLGGIIILGGILVLKR